MKRSRAGVTRALQRSLHCPCGRQEIVARGLCGTCYTLRRQDLQYFGGHREEVLARDGFRCRVPGCTTIKRGKRSIAVHHRVPGDSTPRLMITLCLACHAKVTRTLFLEDDWPELLRGLWREQHPAAHEQKSLAFGLELPSPARTSLFD